MDKLYVIHTACEYEGLVHGYVFVTLARAIEKFDALIAEQEIPYSERPRDKIWVLDVDYIDLYEVDEGKEYTVDEPIRAWVRPTKL